MSRAGSWLLLLVLLFVGVAQAQSADTDTIEVPPDIGEFGLRYPTDEELQAAGKYTAEVLRVLPNDLAIERIKEEKDPSELYNLSLPRGVKKGEEYVFKNGSAEEGGIGTLDFPPGSLPASVDNSTSPAFPPIRSQGGLNSCAAWSTGYYIHTYEYARAKGLVASSGDNSVISSPKFIYNLVNGGDNVGSWPSGNLNLISVVGIPPWSSLPYDADYQSVPSGTAIWRAALQRKSYPFVGSLSDPSGDLTSEALINIKTLLANGSIAEVSVNINSWHTRQVRNDPGTSDDDPFFNQLITSYSDNRNLGGHSMTVVGYNDTIWNDINGNGIVEVSEKGAFKIANSWGVWGNSGFIWVSYDAMRSTTQVPATASWPPSDRGLFGFQWGRLEFQFLMINPDYKPQIIADLDFTSNKVRHVGVSTVATKAGGALVQRGIPMLSNVNGGNSSSLDSVKSLSMALDMTDLILFGEQDLPTKWGMNFVNSSIAGATTTLSRFELFQRQGASYVSRALAAGLPKTLTTAYQSDTRQIDWTFIPLGQRPTAQLVAPATADINSTILLDASGSSDTEGALYGYRYVVDGAFSTLLPSSSMSFVWQYPVIAYGSPLAARMQAIDLDGNVRTDNKNIIRQAAGGGNTPTPTTTPTRTPTLTATSVPPTITPTRTATANPTATQSLTATPTRTVTPSGTLTSTPSPTITVTRTPTPSVSTTATGTPTSTPTDTPTGTPEGAPTLTPTREPTPTATVTQNPTEEPGFTPTAIPNVKKLRPPKIKVSGYTVVVTMKSGGERYSISVKSRACGIRRLASRRNVVRIAPPNTGGKLTYQMFSSGILTGESIKAVSLPRPDQAEQRPRTSQCSLKVGSRSR